VDRCKKRLEKRSAKRHLKTHKMLPDVTHDELLTKLCANKYSSLNDRKFNELIKKFDGRPTKKEMKGFLYPNGEKVYDFEDGTDSKYSML
jgi:hypothetical protein